MSDLIPRRLKAARESANLTQAELAIALGFNDRQTVAAIEAGQRRFSADELVRALDVLKVDLDFFTDRFRLTGNEGRFSWRVSDADAGTLQQFEVQAGKWIATYIRLGECIGAKPLALQSRLPDITVRSSYEAAEAAAEQLGFDWELGEVPADRLKACLEEKLKILILYVDAPPPISGAACRVPSQPVVLINRRESDGRRNFDLAHELFHILTWEQMPPAHDDSKTAKRTEQLANCFAAALLMPRQVTENLWNAKDSSDVEVWIRDIAARLRVSPQALAFRIHNLGLYKDKELPERLGPAEGEERAPQLFGRQFAERLHAGIDGGHISVRRAASLTDLDYEGLERLFVEHNLPVPFEM